MPAYASLLLGLALFGIVLPICTALVHQRPAG